MAGVDLIVQCMTMSEISREACEGLRAAVESGAGLAGWHGGIADSFRANADYQQLIGGQFATHPGKEPSARVGDQADNYLPYTIELAGYVDAARGVGLLDFIAGHDRASGEVALHVLEIMTALLESGASGARIELESTTVVPPLVPPTPVAQWHGAAL